MNRWREEGSDCIQGAPERLDQRFLDQRLFTQDSPMWSCQNSFLPFYSFSFFEGKPLGVRIILRFWFFCFVKRKHRRWVVCFCIFSAVFDSEQWQERWEEAGGDDTQLRKDLNPQNNMNQKDTSQTETPLYSVQHNCKTCWNSSELKTVAQILCPNFQRPNPSPPLQRPLKLYYWFN